MHKEGGWECSASPGAFDYAFRARGRCNWFESYYRADFNVEAIA